MRTKENTPYHHQGSGKWSSSSWGNTWWPVVHLLDPPLLHWTHRGWDEVPLYPWCSTSQWGHQWPILPVSMGQKRIQWNVTYHMNNGITTATIHLVCNGRKDSFPYLCDSIVHDCICCKWVFKCCSPMYKGRLEIFPPIMGVAGACSSTRKGKGGEGVPDLFDTSSTGGCV